MSGTSPLLALTGGAPTVAWKPTDAVPSDASPEQVFIGKDPNGLAFEVAVAYWSGASAPTQEALRRLHWIRLKKRPIPLCVAVRDGRGSAWVYGPIEGAPPLGPRPEPQVARLLQAALGESSATAARSRVLRARDALEDAQAAGIDSQGLFALHELLHGVPARKDWPDAGARGRTLLAGHPRDHALIRGLGYDATEIPGNVLLLRHAKEPPHAAAILLRDDESFDAESARFGRSPIYHGLEIARRNDVRWLIVIRGTQLRLYSTAPDVGVSRRGQTQTYFGIDYALIDDEHAGYLDLIFSSAALRAGGSVDQILEASRDHAAALGTRLRERIYEKVVDRLSVGIAEALGREAPLDEARLQLAYRLTLRVLFRLLFQAYAEDTRLLPLHRNERYTQASLKELARRFAADPDGAFEERSHALWNGLRATWTVIDKGDAEWGVPAYGGGLFGADLARNPDGATIARLVVPDSVIGPALRGLLVDVGLDGVAGPIDFRSLDVRDFGTIYEGLLESGLSLAADDLVVDASGAWRPAKVGELIDAERGTPYFHSKSGDRKATGSYFTKPFAVEHLLERALDPALDAHLERVAAIRDRGDEQGAARALFDFRVADLAMGSGHFLVAAIGHIESRVGAFLETHALPPVERELVDLRQAAVGALRLVGVDEPVIDRSALLGRQIARRCVYGLDLNEIAVELARLAIWVRTFVPGLPMSSLDHQLVCGNSLTGIGTIEEAVQALDADAKDGALSFSGAAIRSALRDARRLLEDAAAMKESTPAEARLASEAMRGAEERSTIVRHLMDLAVAVRSGLVDRPSVMDPEALAEFAQRSGVPDRVAELAPLHFPLNFPEVFVRDDPGFHVLIGNPPWDELHVNADKFWSRHFPGHMGRSDTEKVVLRERYGKERPDLLAQLNADIKAADAARRVIKATFPIGASGDLYRAFCYRYLGVTRSGGRVGVVLPRGATIGASNGSWRTDALAAGRFDDVFHITNRAGWAFDDVHHQYQIVLLTWHASPQDPRVISRGTARSAAEFEAARRDGGLAVGIGPMHRIAPGLGIPALPDWASADIFAAFSGHANIGEVLAKLGGGIGFDGTAGEVRALRRVSVGTPGALQVVQGRHIELWEPVVGEEWVLGSRGHTYPLASREGIVFRKLTRGDDLRTFRVALAPAGTLVKETGYWLTTGRGTSVERLALLAWLSSRVFDWYTRTLVDRHILPSLASMFPVPSGVLGGTASAFLGDLVGRATADPVDVPDAAARVDGVCAHILGLDRNQLRRLLETFHPTWRDPGHVRLAVATFDALADQ